MARSKLLYVCSNCGFESSKWNGRCTNCGEWNTFEEKEAVDVKTTSSFSRQQSAAPSLADKLSRLGEIGADTDVRYDTGLSELNRVLGGGLVKGSIVLIGGEPGIGKSTILLQICQYFGEEHSILYISGEESVRQIKLRAARLNVTTESLYILS